MTDPPSTLPDLPAGVYRHYKGPLYLVLGYGHDATITTRQPVVIYVGLELDEAKTGARLAVRDFDDFFAAVNPHTGVAQTGWDGRDPAPVQRFTYLGPTYAG